jgi:hypothetical protein
MLAQKLLNCLSVLGVCLGCAWGEDGIGGEQCFGEIRESDERRVVTEGERRK